MREGKKKEKKKGKKRLRAAGTYEKSLEILKSSLPVPGWARVFLRVEGISFQRWMPLNRTPPRTLSHGNSSLNAFPTISFPLSFRIDFDIPSSVFFFLLKKTILSSLLNGNSIDNRANSLSVANSSVIVIINWREERKKRKNEMRITRKISGLISGKCGCFFFFAGGGRWVSTIDEKSAGKEREAPRYFRH